MKKMIFLSGLLCLTCITAALHAQSIDKRNWKAYISDPINDTITFHIHSDSSFLTNSEGEVVIRVTCTVIADTLTILNQDSEGHGCRDQKGKYNINLNGDSFTLRLIDDLCEGRAQALTNTTWVETSK